MKTRYTFHKIKTQVNSNSSISTPVDGLVTSTDIFIVKLVFNVEPSLTRLRVPFVLKKYTINSIPSSGTVLTPTLIKVKVIHV